MLGAMPIQLAAWYNAVQPQIFWRDETDTHKPLKEDVKGAQQTVPPAGFGYGLTIPGLGGVLGGNYPLSEVVPAALWRSYLDYQAPEAARKLLLSVSPQEMFVGDVFSAQLLLRPKIINVPTVNAGSENGSIARGALNL